MSQAIFDLVCPAQLKWYVFLAAFHKKRMRQNVSASPEFVIAIHKSYRIHGSYVKVVGIFQKSTHANQNVIKIYDEKRKCLLLQRRSGGQEK